ncbi:hypothetical protein LIT25_16135 [Bacillus sp. F19]|nr:hypothetical protein LIT25_16135 [Bacillus sp. F19]
MEELEGRTLPVLESDIEYLSYIGSTISEMNQKLYNSKEGKNIIEELIALLGANLYFRSPAAVIVVAVAVTVTIAIIYISHMHER